MPRIHGEDRQSVSKFHRFKSVLSVYIIMFICAGLLIHIPQHTWNLVLSPNKDVTSVRAFNTANWPSSEARQSPERISRLRTYDSS